jgi:hypothetical protein
MKGNFEPTSLLQPAEKTWPLVGVFKSAGSSDAEKFGKEKSGWNVEVTGWRDRAQ